MHANSKNDKINFAPNNLTLHSFLATRNSLKNNTKFPLKSAEIYKKARCKEENQPNAKMRNIYEQRIGKYPPNFTPCVNLRHTKLDRNLFESKSFHLSPTIYDTTKVPFASRRGVGSANWSSLPRGHECASNSAVYDTPRELERLTIGANAHKGVFLSNIVESSCVPKWRPVKKHVSIVEQVTPVMLNPQQHTLAYNAAPRIRTPKPNPHLFLRSSCVPEKLMSFLPRHQSFMPAVGRYDVTQPGSHQLPSDKVQKAHNKQKPTSQRNTVLQRSLCMPVIATRIPSKLLANSSATRRRHKPISRRKYALTLVKPNTRFGTYIVTRKSKLNAKNNEKTRRPSTSAVITRQLVSRLTEERAHKQVQSNLQYKRNFKFLPLPQPKVLVRKIDLLPASLACEPSYLYFRDIDVNNYLKKVARQPT